MFENTSLKKRLRHLIPVLLFVVPFFLQAQEKNWDNQMYLGNKVTFGEHKWKFSGELQVRLENDFQSLDNWYFEFIANYLLNKHIEIVPDFRYTIKPTKTEIRPGIGVLYKFNSKSGQFQFVNQLKYQIDIDNQDLTGHAFREVMFVNRKLNDKVVATLVTGFIYRWWPHWNGFQYIRVGPGLTYIYDDKHTLNFSHFVGVENNTEKWVWAGIPMVQLVINISKKYKYKPAYYFEF